jgi:hypothetical protein
LTSPPDHKIDFGQAPVLEFLSHRDFRELFEEGPMFTGKRKPVLRKVTGVLSAFLVLSVGLAIPAMATAYSLVQWHSTSSPLKVYEDGIEQARAWGNWYNEDHTYARNGARQYDMKPGGNSIYVATKFLFFVEQFGTTYWWNSGTSETKRTSSASWIYDYDHKELHGHGRYARGEIKICEAQAWSGDPCSTTTRPGFNY